MQLNNFFSKNKKMEQTNSNLGPNSIMNKKNILLWFLIVFSALLVVFFSFTSVKKIVTNNKTGNTPTASREELIKEKIGNFSIEEEFAYQGGTIIKAIRKNGVMINQRATLFFKGNQLQQLPDEYVIDSTKAQLSNAEKENKLAAFKYQEKYNSGSQDKDGKDIIYGNVFLMTNELPESEWVENAMYPLGLGKYQAIIIDEFGQMQDKFISSQIL
jgi:hypothetical protein